MAKIVIADVEEGIERMEGILKDRHELRRVMRLHALRCLLQDEPVDLIVLGVHFDESRMFDALRMIKAHRQWRKIPVVCFRQLKSKLDFVFNESFEIACRALGAEMYLNSQQFHDQYADPDFEILCEIERHLPRVLHTEPACEERNDDLYDSCELPVEDVNLGRLRSVENQNIGKNGR